MYSNFKEKTLDVLLDYAQRHELMTYNSDAESLKGCHFPYHKRAIILHPFAFQVHCHETGNSVRGYILTYGKPYEIINGTFWKRSGYEHNPFKWEKGAWDNALKSVISDLKDCVDHHMNMAERLRQDEMHKATIKQAETKASVEEMFR